MMLPVFSDEYFMNEALKEAQKALDEGEMPVGAVIVCNNQIIARMHNFTERINDVTIHAEMQAFTTITESSENKQFNECTLYVTLEPCVMCAGAAFWVQIGKIVYGTRDEERGFQNTGLALLHPQTILVGNVLEERCREMMERFLKRQKTLNINTTPISL